MAVLLPSSVHHPQPKPPQTPKPISSSQFSLSSNPKTLSLTSNKRDFLFQSLSLCIASLILEIPTPISATEAVSSSKSILSAILNTKSWFQFFGAGFSIRIPPEFVDVMEPEDFNAGLSLYGDKAKTKTFAARFASPDGYEVVSVIIKPSNSLKITFLEAQDITDLGSLKEAAKIFIPGGSSLYSARTIKIKEDEGFRTYYFYEFGRDEQRVALVAAVSGGKAFVAGATSPESRWDSDGVKLRSAALSMTLL
ncbi:hypothetical protein SOVF_023410 [Spinacia oleracea]|uniref:PsbP C-terminal domain-containing protein n=1 Tax=Spinacia oleracea TaxID=3562 RepID=A0A9R0I1E2_SPIOL|nr:uncharacterized protein LOC110780898 [Spinacia oleracea]KNA23625.1 hypothetical protein SOVF_023410 [Spinacia oleracea]